MLNEPAPAVTPDYDRRERETSRSHSLWIEAKDGERLFCHFFAGAPGAPVIVYLHGIEGHGQWFSETASALNKKGFTIYMPDRRGAGRNERNRGHIHNYRQWLDDTTGLLIKVKEKHKHSPVFLAGNCWAGKLATLVALQPEVEQLGLAGLVLISPALSTRVDLSLLDKFFVAVHWLIGSRRFFALPIDTCMFTDSPAYHNFIECDQWRLKAVTASFLVENIKLSAAAAKAARQLKLPLLVLQAGRDQIVDVLGVEKWFANVPAADKQMYVFSWSEHCLDFDEHAPEYRRCLEQWLLERAVGGAR